MVSATTEFDYLMKNAFSVMFPKGFSEITFRTPNGVEGYKGGVRPDFILPDGRWIDFKLSVSFRESHNVAWQPSALYASLRKYIDHSNNPDKKLIVVYGKIYGTIKEVKFPICRGKKILIADENEFKNKVILTPATKAIERLKGTSSEWMIAKLKTLLSK